MDEWTSRRYITVLICSSTAVVLPLLPLFLKSDCSTPDHLVLNFKFRGFANHQKMGILGGSSREDPCSVVSLTFFFFKVKCYRHQSRLHYLRSALLYCSMGIKSGKIWPNVTFCWVWYNTFNKAVKCIIQEFRWLIKIPFHVLKYKQGTHTYTVNEWWWHPGAQKESSALRRVSLRCCQYQTLMLNILSCQQKWHSEHVCVQRP